MDKQQAYEIGVQLGFAIKMAGIMPNLPAQPLTPQINPQATLQSPNQNIDSAAQGAMQPGMQTPKTPQLAPDAKYQMEMDKIDMDGEGLDIKRQQAEYNKRKDEMGQQHNLMKDTAGQNLQTGISPI